MAKSLTWYEQVYKNRALWWVSMHLISYNWLKLINNEEDIQKMSNSNDNNNHIWLGEVIRIYVNSI